MLICQWHLDIVYGKQGEARAESCEPGERRSSPAPSSGGRGGRVCSPASLVPRLLTLWMSIPFESLADFEAALASMAAPQFRAHSDALAPFIVPGSQHWVVYRVLE